MIPISVGINFPLSDPNFSFNVSSETTPLLIDNLITVLDFASVDPFST